MPSDYPHLRYLFDRDTHLAYRRLMKTFETTLAFDASDIAKFRLHVLEYFYKYGLRPVLDAFGVRKSTLYDWKKAYESSGKKLNSLVPKSTRPKRLRQMRTDWRLVVFIEQIRKKYGNTGARIIKPFLDEYAKSLGIKTLGRTTIEKVIKRHKLTFDNRNKAKRSRKASRLRIRKSPRVKSPGYVQMDTIELRILTDRYYFVSIIDIFTKFAQVELIKTRSSYHTKEAFRRFQEQYQYQIHTVQTDNGSEFLKSFDDHLRQQQIEHVFIYPRSPKINGIVERFNRTVQEEFINRSDDLGIDQKRFRTKLNQYLNWYNQRRPHSSLGYLSPTQFINSQIPKGV